MRQSFLEKQIQIHQKCPSEMSLIWGDRERLEIAVRNIFEHLLQHMHYKEEVSIFLQETEHEIHLHIQNTGPGIPEEIVTFIFNQTENFKDKEGESIYKDLSLTKYIFEMHHGQVFCEMGENDDNHFILVLPKDLRQKVRIVIADDNPGICQTLKDILTESDYQVDTVSNGYELIAYLKESTPNIVILDLMMPQKDGTEVFDTIRSMSMDIKIIIYTGFQRYEGSVFAHTAEKFILKDEDPKKLLKAIEELS